MLLSDLPQEIIEQLTRFLSLRDKKACSLVCKSWKGVFQDSLYSDLVINQQLLNDLVNPPQDYQHPRLKTGFLVRCLKIYYHTLKTDENLYVLQKIFPNIKSLNISMETIFQDKVGVTNDWNIWRSLTELSITFDHSPEPDIKNKFIEILLCLPLLKWLNISSGRRFPIRIAFSLDDFETIHSHLNHLVHLRLSSNLLTLSEKDIERMTKVSPATKMRTLEIISRNGHYRWLCYFARKYPNLYALRLYISNVRPETDIQRSNTISLFQQVPLPFQRLEILNFEYPNWAGKDYLPFCGIIHFHNMPLKHVSISIHVPEDAYSPDNLFDIPKYIVQVWLPKSAKTLEALYLNCSNRHSVPIDFTEIKGKFYNLVDLNINTPTYIEMDTLLYAAPCLESILLKYTDIKVKDELYNPNRFELMLFEVDNSKITSDVLRFLSFHCRSLDELNLEDTSVYGNFTTPGCQFIDMTYTRLDTVHIVNTSFIIQDNEKCPENLNITLITRPVDDIPPKQDYDPNVLPVVVGGPPVKAHYNWFYTDHDNETEEMPPAKGSRVQKFVANYEKNKENVLKRTLDKTRRKPYVSQKKNYVFGYTKISLGYVDYYMS